MRLKKYQSGFTLIELLVIISIIGFLVASIMFYLAQTRQKSRNAKRVADVKQISAALDLFLSHCNYYPVNTTPLVIDSTRKLFTGTGANCGTRTGSSSVNGGFGLTSVNLTANNLLLVSQLVAAPLPADGSCTNASGSNSYTYTTNATGTTYTLSFCLGEQSGGYPAGVNSIIR